tara:strand:- start:3329 stop:3460 length:132 start_codon:yes stop_codon:yes gene_type:complete
MTCFFNETAFAQQMRSRINAAAGGITNYQSILGNAAVGGIISF